MSFSLSRSRSRSREENSDDVDVCSSLVWSLLLEDVIELEAECVFDDVRVCVFGRGGCACLGVCRVEYVRGLRDAPWHFLKMETIIHDPTYPDID